MALYLLLGCICFALASAGEVENLHLPTERIPISKGEHSIDEQLAAEPRKTKQLNETDNRTTLLKKCLLYMAKSTVEGAGMGIFTVTSKKRGERIGWGGDPVLPIDLNRIMSASTVDDESKRHAALMLRNYTWSTRLARAQQASEVLALGVEALMNSHLAAANAGPVLVANDTYSQAVALTSIPAGGEVWSYYGDHWFRGREDFLDSMPGSKDYEAAEALIQTAFSSLLKDNEIETSTARDFWAMMKEWKLVSGEGERVWNAFPATLDDAKQVAASSMSAFHQASRSEDDLMEDSTARCVDSIRAVGDKALATREFATGAVITGTPLLHFVEGRRYLDHDVLTNCFGHMESTVVVCPYAPGVTALIPKGGEQGGKVPNVGVQWAPKGHMHHNASLLEEPVSELLKFTVPVTALDFVALREIAAGEELVLEIPKERTTLESIIEAWNMPHSLSGLILRTPEEQKDNPYPGNMDTRCHKSLLTYTVESSSKQEESLEWKEETMLPCRVEERFVEAMSASITYSLRLQTPEGWVGIGGVPRGYIRFVDSESVTPLSIFPESWKTNALSWSLDNDEL